MPVFTAAATERMAVRFAGVEEEPWRAHDPRVVALDRQVGWITTACVSGAWAFATLLAWGFFDFLPIVPTILAIGWLPITAGVAALSHRWPAIQYRHARYRLTPERVEIEHGVLWRRSIFVPRSRVQHLEVSRGPFERQYGLATLTIYTAGTLHSAVPLRGLAAPDALHLRDDLLPRAPMADGV